eukprot:3278931-Alexandrium_andersonii.AAC.1
MGLPPKGARTAAAGVAMHMQRAVTHACPDPRQVVAAGKARKGAVEPGDRAAGRATGNRARTGEASQRATEQE